MVMRGEKGRALVNHKAQEGAPGGEKSWAPAHTGGGISVGTRKLQRYNTPGINVVATLQL
jgi:hypothetical protein